MLKVLGIKGWGFNIDFGSFLFGLKYSDAEECIEMEYGEDELFGGTDILFLFVGPFSMLVIF